MSDVDGNLEERKGTVSVFNGPLPAIHVVETKTPSATRSVGGSAPESPKVCNPVRSACLSGPSTKFVEP